VFLNHSHKLCYSYMCTSVRCWVCSPL